MSGKPPSAIVVLGCRVQSGQPSTTLERRLRTALELSERHPTLPVILSGGRLWQDLSEARAMSQWWRQRRPETRLIEEDESMSTSDNARAVARLRSAQQRSIFLVTSDFHMPRAQLEFERCGFVVEAVPAPTPRDVPRRWRTFQRERLATWIRHVTLPWTISLGVLSTGCPSEKESPAAPLAPSATTTPAEAKPKKREVLPPLPVDEQLEELRRFARRVRYAPGVQAHEKSVALAKRALFASPEMRLWAAFALGRFCSRAKSPEILAPLVNAASLWATDEHPPPSLLLANLGWAIGSCSLPESEEVLRSWLSPDTNLNLPGLDEAAALGLAAIVDRRGVLSERTQTSVLNAAARLDDAALLLPLSRLPRLSDAVGAHLLEVAASLLTQTSDSRRAAILALPGAGSSSAPPLAQILIADHFTPAEQAAAAQALGRLGGPGQRALDDAVQTQLSRGIPLAAKDPRWIALLASVRELEQPRQSKSALRQLESLALPEGSEPARLAQRRRLVRLRCRAADLLAGTSSLAASLRTCDPDGGREAKLAQLRVLDRDSLTDRRLEIFQEHLRDDDPLIVQTALRMLSGHSEVKHQGALVVDALGADVSGTQTAALQLVAAFPGRFGQASGLELHQSLLDALRALLDPKRSPPLPEETRAAALMAAGALHALNLKPMIEALCRGNEPLLWAPAERSLSLLEKNPPTCPPDRETVLTHETMPADLAPDATSPSSVLTLDSDLGPLELHFDAPRTDWSRQHVLRQFAAGQYDGAVVGSNRLGYAVQFGDEHADGYDETPAPGLPFEVSPALFEAGAFGLSSFAAGSENRQLFVLLTDALQLHGTRIRLGTAKGPWDLLVEGDVLHRVGPLTK